MTISTQAPELQVIPTVRPVRHRLLFAQERLLNCNVPFQLAAISYLRICCSAKQTYQRLGIDSTTPILSTTPYQTLLNQLIEIDVDWWKRCFVSATGYLISNDRRIRELLQPLNIFVEQILNK